MKISLSATNPCHLYDLAVALHAEGKLGRFYSGYPRWKLRPPAGFPLVARSAHTLVTYGLLRCPSTLRPASHRLFRWQDTHFDRAVSHALDGEHAQFLHAMPGQALATFRSARDRGIRTVLNHASGPVRQQLELVADEYRRAGERLELHHGFDADYFRREEEEYASADQHCAASTLVKKQLVASGVSPDRIWVVPYAADPARFFSPTTGARDPLHLVFAGQLSLRKGLRIAFDALDELRKTKPFRLEVYGSVNDDMRSTLAAVGDAPGLRLLGAVDQTALGAVFRRAGMLILPSWEEAFGLVVVQALNCGLPCIVSDRVGAADVIEHRVNGSIFPAGDAIALAREIAWWSENQAAFRSHHPTWTDCARQLAHFSAA